MVLERYQIRPRWLLQPWISRYFKGDVRDLPQKLQLRRLPKPLEKRHPQLYRWNYEWQSESFGNRGNCRLCDSYLSPARLQDVQAAEGGLLRESLKKGGYYNCLNIDLFIDISCTNGHQPIADMLHSSSPPRLRRLATPLTHQVHHLLLCLAR